MEVGDENTWFTECLHNFNQAGLILRIDHENYIKTGIEFVKTNHYVRRPDKKVPIITQAHKKDIMKSPRAKTPVRRLLMSIFFLECIGMTSVYSQVHEAIKPYVDSGFY